MAEKTPKKRGRPKGSKSKQTKALEARAKQSHPGPSNPNWKGGTSPSSRYSRHVPTRLAARMEQAMIDPEGLSARAELALIEARLAEVLERTDTGEAGRHWKAIVSLNQRLILTLLNTWQTPNTIPKTSGSLRQFLNDAKRVRPIAMKCYKGSCSEVLTSDVA